MRAALCLSSILLINTFVFQEYWQDSFCMTMHLDYIKCFEKFLTVVIYRFKFISHRDLVIRIVMRVLHRPLRLDTGDLETQKCCSTVQPHVFRLHFSWGTNLYIDVLEQRNVAVFHFTYCKNIENQKRWHKCKYFHFPPNSEKHLQSRKVLCLSFLGKKNKEGSVMKQV